MPALAILCPGQSAQHPQMFDLARSVADFRTPAGIARWLERHFG